jgi:hypothetical protein
MTDDTDLQPPQFELYRICIHCDSAFRREELSGRAIASGLYTCPECGLDSPLIVEVREIEASDGSKNNSPGTDSSDQR